jgi:hypothetical protein
VQILSADVWAASGPATRPDGPSALSLGLVSATVLFFAWTHAATGLELYDAVNAFLHLFRSKFEFTLLLATEKKRTSE